MAPKTSFLSFFVRLSAQAPPSNDERAFAAAFTLAAFLLLFVIVADIMSNTTKGIAALNVYKKVAIVRKSSDTLTYEDDQGNTKTISELAGAVSSAVSRLNHHRSTHAFADFYET